MTISLRVLTCNLYKLMHNIILSFVFENLILPSLFELHARVSVLVALKVLYHA